MTRQLTLTTLLTLALLLLPATAAWSQTQPADGFENPEVTAPQDQADPGAETPDGQQGGEGQGQGQGANDGSGGGGGSGYTMIFVLVGVMLLFMFLGQRSRKKQEKQRQEMLAGLKKGNKVTSIGGVIGTVIDVKDDEVLVKVDEQNNVRMRFARWAIRGIGEAGKQEKPEDQKQ